MERSLPVPELLPRSLSLLEELRGTSDVELLGAYAEHESEQVQIAVASNVRTPDSVLSRMAKINNSYPILYAVAVNPNASDETIDAVLNDNGLSDSVGLLGKDFPVLSTPSARTQRRREVANIVHTLIAEGRHSRGKPKHRNPLSPSLLEGIFRYSLKANAEDRRFIHEGLAFRDDLPYGLHLSFVKFILEAEDENFNVRSAIYRYFESQKNIPAEILEVFMEGDNLKAIEELAGHSESPEYITRAFYRLISFPEKSFTDQNYSVSSFYISILGNPKTPVEIAVKCHALASRSAGSNKFGANYISRAVDSGLEQIILHEGNGRKFLEANGVDISSLPDSYLVRIVLLTAEEAGLMDLSEFEGSYLASTEL